MRRLKAATFSLSTAAAYVEAALPKIKCNVSRALEWEKQRADPEGSALCQQERLTD